jgi:hypothetical protein
MPIVPFDSLPDESRVWVFASDRPVERDAADRLIEAVDGFLEQWKAHGAPLRCGREWRDDRFLIVGVDTTVEGASGCSIDGLFRTLQRLETAIGARLVGGGRVFFRDPSGHARAASREEFADLAEHGTVTAETPVFDTSLTSAGEWRASFERPAGESWTAGFFA